MAGMTSVIKTIGIGLAIMGMAYLKYRRAKLASDRKDQKPM
jgi:hypothetical protein